MIDELLDKINNYKVKAIKKRAARLEKYAEAKEKLSKVETKINKLKPKRQSNSSGQAGPNIMDQLANFGEGCAKASEQMNKNLFGGDNNGN